MKSLLGPFVLRRLKQEVAGQLTTKSHATGEGGAAGRLGAVPSPALCPAAGRSAAVVTPAAHCFFAPGPTPPHTFVIHKHAHILPPRVVAAEFIEMSEEQAGLYAASVAKMRSQITGKAAAAAADRSNKGVERFLRTLGAKKISHMFTHLRKIAQHPLLVRSNYTDDQVAAIAEIAFEK